ncbi:MAG: hypothetical protein LC624_05775 [Halobacteriales archaeon]|nr:hypothetical protein [Halobacteriales archaeon]
MAKPWLLLAALAALLLAVPAQAEPALTALASPSPNTLADASWRSDGAMALAVGGQPGEGVALRVEDGVVRLAHEGPQRFLAVAWHPSLPFALVTGDDTLLRTDGLDFTRLALPDGVAPFNGRSVSWKPDGSEALVSGSALLRFTTATGRLDVVRQAADESFGPVAWSPRGDVALVEQAQRTAGAWRLGRLLTFDGAQLVHVADAGSGDALVTRIAWKPDGTSALLATLAPSGAGSVLRWEQGALAPGFTPARGSVAGIAWRAGTALLAGGGGLGLAQTDGAALTPLRDVPVELLAAAWQPGGEQALLAGAGGALYAWEPPGVPRAHIAAPLPGAVLNTPIRIIATASAREGHGLEAVQWRLDEGAWRGMSLDGASWRAPWDVTDATEGVHTLRVRARDDAGPGPEVRSDVRVSHATPTPALRADLDGAVAKLTWTDTGDPMYEVQDALDPAFADAQVLARTAHPGATLSLGAGEHHVRVRSLGIAPGPWSAPLVLHVLTKDSQPATPALPPPDAPPARLVPAPSIALLALAGLAGARLARRAR